MVRVHFLNVGYGDCAIVHFPARETRNSSGKVVSRQDERVMMIDLYHHDSHDEYEDIFNYYKENFKNSDNTYKPIFRFVCTHPHKDHIGGLDKLFRDNDINILNFWDVDHEWEPEDFDENSSHKEDWEMYKNVRQRSSNPTIIRVTSDNTPAKYWDHKEDKISVLSPSKQMIENAHRNEDGTKKKPEAVEIDQIAYVLMVEVNNRKLIFASDVRSDVWDGIIERFGDKISNVSVLKAGHHGHESGFHEEAVKLMNPELIVFSNSQDEDDSNGASDLYEEALDNPVILKTFKHGTRVVNIPFKDIEPISLD